MKVAKIWLAWGLAWLLCTASATAQEPVNAADAATAPSPGHAVLREQFRFYSLSLREGPRSRRGEIGDAMVMSMLNVGIARDWSLSLRTPVVFRDRDFDRRVVDDGNDAGVGDLMLLAKYRVWRRDTGPIDTARLSLIAGADIRSGDSPFTSDGYDPIVGVAYTQVAGRHGANASLQYTFTTGGNAEPIFAGEGTADLLRYDLAYLYRLWPAQYTEDTHGAFYGVLELNGLYETNGDHELFLAPGLMYEANWWTLELSVQLPVWKEVRHRAETEFAVIVGIRLSF